MELPLVCLAAHDSKFHRWTSGNVKLLLPPGRAGGTPFLVRDTMPWGTCRVTLRMAVGDITMGLTFRELLVAGNCSLPGAIFDLERGNRMRFGPIASATILALRLLPHTIYAVAQDTGGNYATSSIGVRIRRNPHHG